MELRCWRRSIELDPRYSATPWMARHRPDLIMSWPKSGFWFLRVGLFSWLVYRLISARDSSASFFGPYACCASMSSIARYDLLAPLWLLSHRNPLYHVFHRRRILADMKFLAVLCISSSKSKISIRMVTDARLSISLPNK